MRNLALVALLALTALAGCVADQSPTPQAGDDLPAPLAPGDLGTLVNQTLTQGAPIVLVPSIVDAAVDYTGDLYEPTIEVCEDGSIYITAHTIAADTTGAPVFGSHDQGATWQQLPWLQALALPTPVQGATPPPSDEIFLACGDAGWLYGVDITLATYPVNAWADNGARHAYYNPNAYNEAEVVTDADTESGCVPVPAKDRPWGAYENGTLLMVSNPAGGPAQVGVMAAPPALAAEAGGAVSTQWNLCAGPGGSIPGIPDIRADGQFVVPQLADGKLALVLGDKADIEATEVYDVFDTTTGGEITSVYGIAAFDANGTLFVGISNNTYKGTGEQRKLADGGIQLAVSHDAGASFVDRVFSFPGKPLRHFYMDANENGPGALVVWAVDGEEDGNGNQQGYDWYVGHLRSGLEGRPELTGVHLVIEAGPQPSAHVTGAAVGPDGRAYLAMYEPASQPVGPLSAPKTAGTPLSVYIQTGGPTLPVTATA